MSIFLEGIFLEPTQIFLNLSLLQNVHNVVVLNAMFLAEPFQKATRIYVRKGRLRLELQNVIPHLLTLCQILSDVGSELFEINVA